MIDSHLHLWQLDTGWYDWNTPDLGPVHADSGLAQVRPAMTEAGVTGAVVVQAADTLAETRWLLDLAAREPLILGVVGYLPLDDPASLDHWLAQHEREPLVGVRQLWHDHDNTDDLTAPATLDCLRLLGERGLPVDVPDAFPGLWSALLVAVEQSPGTRFVLDHCGKPPFGDADAWLHWETGFAELADHPNVVIKLSGLFGGSGSTTTATPEELDRVVELTRSRAGGQRTMIGSDWPLTRGSVDYASTISHLDTLLAGWSLPERDQALTRTSLATYGISLV